VKRCVQIRGQSRVKNSLYGKPIQFGQKSDSKISIVDQKLDFFWRNIITKMFYLFTCLKYFKLGNRGQREMLPFHSKASWDKGGFARVPKYGRKYFCARCPRRNGRNCGTFTNSSISPQMGETLFLDWI